MAIPKVIHYCWLSGEPYSDLVQKCMKSWQRYLPDYQFILWDREKIQEFDSVSAIEENLQRISTYNVQEVYEKKMSQIATIVNEKKYSELLIICNLKTEITRGVANRYLDSNYETKAVQQIQTNEELKKAIKKKYFK